VPYLGSSLMLGYATPPGGLSRREKDAGESGGGVCVCVCVSM
jgi:hypothetical protein